MDKSTVLGLIIGFGAVVASVIAEHGDLLRLLNLPGALIVFGGCAGALLISHPLPQVMRLPRIIAKAFGPEVTMPVDQVEFYVKLAEKARREGLLALENDADQIDDRFTKKGLLMVVDGIDPEVVRAVMEKDMEVLAERHHRGAEMLDALGGYAPTMGIIGTVMGLVNVLSNLSQPSELGGSISTAFIATLYGVGSANLIWLPLGGKLKAKSQTEMDARRLTLDAVLSIQAGDNPRIVREKLEVHLNPAQRGGVSERASKAATEQGFAPA